MTTTTTPTTYNNKVVCFYHNNCTDGMMSAVIAKFYHYKDDFVAVPVQYQKADEKDKTPILGDNVDRLYILDFSFSPERTIPLLFKSDGSRRDVIMLDHHLSALNEWFSERKENILFKKLEDKESTYNLGDYLKDKAAFYYSCPAKGGDTNFSCQIDMERSGALMTFEYFTQLYGKINESKTHDHEKDSPYTPIFEQCWDMLKLLSTYVSDRDLWKFEHEKTAACYELLNSWKQDVDVWLDNIYCYATKRDCGAIHDDLNKAQARVDMRDELATEYAVKAKKMTILGNTGMIVNVPSNFSSLVASKLYDQEGIEFVLCYVVGGANYVLFSMRSSQKKDFDCEAVAKVMGGGGHKNAAGFRGDITLLTDFLNAIVKT